MAEAKVKDETEKKVLDTKAEAKGSEKAPAEARETKVDETQAKRDAHYFENGVQADGTGGVSPESE